MTSLLNKLKHLPTIPWNQEEEEIKAIELSQLESKLVVYVGGITKDEKGKSYIIYSRVLNNVTGNLVEPIQKEIENIEYYHFMKKL